MARGSGSRAEKFDCADKMKQGGGTAKLSIRPACHFGPTIQRRRSVSAKGGNMHWQIQDIAGPPKSKGGRSL